MSNNNETSIHDEPSNLLWFAAFVRSNYEHVTAHHLRQRGYEEFNPTFKTERHWSDRAKMVDRNLFPGYVFCRLNPNKRLNVITIPGLKGLVSLGRAPAPIPEAEIEAVRRMVS